MTSGANGQTIIDDTYNANPAGARPRSPCSATWPSAAMPAKRVVVTPGMVELGARQAEENARFARAAGQVATHLVVVGSTNAAALLAGATGHGARGDPGAQPSRGGGTGWRPHRAG